MPNASSGVSSALGMVPTGVAKPVSAIQARFERKRHNRKYSDKKTRVEIGKVLTAAHGTVRAETLIASSGMDRWFWRRAMSCLAFSVQTLPAFALLAHE